MTLEEKLDHFTALTIENALKKSADILQEYKENAENVFEKHRETVLNQLDEEERVAKEAVRRAAAREYTLELMHIRRKHNHKQEELREKLFAEVDGLLTEFKKTRDYTELLARYISEAKQLAGEEKINIYIDAEDADMAGELSERTGAELIISEKALGGGVKAEIPSRNMLIDNTFFSKIEEIKEKYIVGSRGTARR